MGDRQTLLFPERKAAVEEGGTLVSQPAQHPPEAHREISGEVVVDHDLFPRRHAARIDLRGERFEVGQRMAAVHSSLRPGEVVVHVQEIRARDMSGGVGARPLVRIEQVVARVEYDPVGIIQVGGELFRRYQDLFHGWQFSGLISSNVLYGIIGFKRRPS